MRFRYWATTTDGTAQDGVLNAASPAEARRNLTARGLTILSLETDEDAVAVAARNRVARSLSGADKLAFFLHLSVLLKSGVPITDSLEAIAEGGSEALAATSAQVLKRVEEGHPLSQAMAATGRFHRVSISLLKIAEATGRLVAVCDRLADRIRKLQLRRQETIATLAYPLAIAAVSALLLFFLIYYMLPQFTPIFAELGGELPAMTRVLVALAEGPWLPVAAGLAVLTALGLYMAREHPNSQLFLEKLLYESPLVGPLAQKALMSRLSQDLALMVDLGVPIDRALGQLNDPTTGFYAMDEALRVAQVELRATGDLVGALLQAQRFPPLWVQMVQVGFESGKLSSMLSSYARLTDTEVEQGAESLTQMLEPLLLAGMGLTVGAIVLSAFLPMYQLLEKL